MLDKVEDENITFRPLIKKKDDSHTKLPLTGVITLNKLGTPNASSSKVIKYKSETAAQNDAVSISNASTNVRSAEIDQYINKDKDNSPKKN